MATDELQEQVLVAGFPNRPPEVHVASLDATRRSINLKEAKVMGNGDISFGRETVISLADAAEVDSTEENMLALLGRDGSLLVQLHLESTEDQRLWGDGIRAGIKGASRAAPDPGGKSGPPGSPAARPASANGPVTEDTDGEVHLLQARSRQLQTQIGQLEAANERRDQQLQKMMSRLDGAVQMLVAVQDMCGQQRKVIVAQKVAIDELTRECGGAEEAEEDEDIDTDRRDEAAQGGEATGKKEHQGSRALGAQAASTSGDHDTEEEIAAKTEKMLALLQRADDLQRTLGEMGAEAGGSEQASAAPRRAAPQQEQEERLAPVREAPADKAAEEEEAADRLQTLEAEKQRFEGMLRDSQAEHDDLLQRLTDMRSLMSMLGMQPENADASDTSSDEGPGTHPDGIGGSA